jgi:argininosuccinate lyase
MKLWDKGISTDKKIEQFTIGKDRELDVFLAPHDVLGSIAHVRMLQYINLLTVEELGLLENGLKNIYREISDGTFQIEDGVEDVHSQIELMLTRRLGDVGKKIHSGRSRNDQVLVDLKLFIRDEIREIVRSMELLFDILISQSEKYKNILIPGYTHMQVAMPSSFGLWFGAYAESLCDDLHLFHAAYKIANQNPLGSAAGYGSSFPLNRTMTTRLLGFETLNYNVVYAQMGRGKTERSLSFALSSLAGTLGKLATDICLYNSQNFGFIVLPDNLTTGSSIMPHKKNPDVFELTRAKCNQIQSLPNEISLIMANLPSGYHRDMQIIKESLMPAIVGMKACLEISQLAISQMQVKENLLEDPRYKYLFSVDAVNEEVLKGMPFREAYQKIAKQIADGSYQDVKLVNHKHEGSIGNLCNDKIKEKMKNTLRSFAFDNIDDAIKKLIG